VRCPCGARPGVAHIDFSDEPWWDGSMTEALRPGRERTIAETRACCACSSRRPCATSLTRLRTLFGAPLDQITVECFGPFAK
jgi:hypothetical protein